MQLRSDPFRAWLLAFCLLAGLVPASAARADRELAAPGPCAEPREAVSGVAPSSLSVVGPLQSFFNPADVAAAPIPPSRSLPEASAVMRRGACDVPGAGCAQAPQPAALGAVPPIVPGPRPNAGAGLPASSGPTPGPGGVLPGGRPAPPNP